MVARKKSTAKKAEDEENKVDETTEKVKITEEVTDTPDEDVKETEKKEKLDKEVDQVNEAIAKAKAAAKETKETFKEEPSINWRNDGGGSFRFIRNKIIKPGEVFEAKVSQIPKAFRDVIVPLQEVPKEFDVDEDLTNEFSLKHRGGGKYIIVDSNGKAILEKPVEKEKAAEILKSLL